MQRKSAVSASAREGKPPKAVSRQDPRGSDKASKRKKPKRSFVQGLRDRVKTMISLGRTLVNEPRAFPSQLQRVLLQWARNTWQAQGGGFYAAGFVVTFVFLEIKLVFVDLFGSAGPGGFLAEQIMQLLFRFTVDSLVNTVLALIWPALVLQWWLGWGLVALAAGYFLFNRFVKEPLTEWLFDDD